MYDIYAQYFHKLINAYTTVAPYVETTKEFDSLLENKRKFLEKLEKPEFSVAFLGFFSAGKSSLINSILGYPYLPESMKVATAVPTLIKAGKECLVTIYYLNDKEKEELKSLYIEELASSLNVNVTEDSDIEIILKKFSSKIGSDSSSKKALDALEKLITDWNAINKTTENISLGDLKKYVTEDNPNNLFINRVEVSLPNVDFPENTVLIDLPGLGVVNPRHKKLTLSYIEKHAKAFVITISSHNLTEGDGLKFLAKIQHDRPYVLSRAFLVVNQWDLVLSDENKKGVEAHIITNFQEFSINKERIFYVSALQYLLLKLAADSNCQDDYFKKHAKQLQTITSDYNQLSPETAKKLISTVPHTHALVLFKEALFDYLNSHAKREFLSEAREECLDFANKIKELLNSQYIPDSSTDNFIHEITHREANASISRVRKILDEQPKAIWKSFSNETFWNATATTELNTALTELVKTLDRQTILDSLSHGMDITLSLSRLGSALEAKLAFNKVFRKKIHELVDNMIVRRYMRPLLEELQREKYLSPDMQNFLSDYLGDRDIQSRFSGLCDYFMYEYGNCVDKASVSVSEKPADSGDRNNSRGRSMPQSMSVAAGHEDKFSDGQLERLISSYEKSVVSYIVESAEKVNTLAFRSFKNYLTELEQQILAKLTEEQNAIFRVVSKAINKDDVIIADLKKQQIINQTYTQVDNIIVEITTNKLEEISYATEYN